MAKRKKGKKLNKQQKKWLGGIAVALGAVLAIGAVVAIARGNEEGKVLSSWFDFEVGAVDETGKFDKDAKTNIVSDLIEVEGMTIELENEDLSYEVHYYDEDEKYISSTAAMTLDFDANEAVLPDLAVYARVEITHAEDDEITFGERLEYLKDVTVTIPNN